MYFVEWVSILNADDERWDGITYCEERMSDLQKNFVCKWQAHLHAYEYCMWHWAIEAQGFGWMFGKCMCMLPQNILPSPCLMVWPKHVGLSSCTHECTPLSSQQQLPHCAAHSQGLRHRPGVSPIAAVIWPSPHLPLLLNLISDQQPKNWKFQQHGSCYHCIPADLLAHVYIMDIWSPLPVEVRVSYSYPWILMESPSNIRTEWGLHKDWTRTWCGIRSPLEVHQESTWSPSRVHQESSWSPSGPILR